MRHSTYVVFNATDVNMAGGSIPSANVFECEYTTGDIWVTGIAKRSIALWELVVNYPFV